VRGFLVYLCFLQHHCLHSDFKERSSWSEKHGLFELLSASAYLIVDVTHLSFTHFESCVTSTHHGSAGILCSLELQVFYVNGSLCQWLACIFLAWQLEQSTIDRVDYKKLKYSFHNSGE
jgi:hypothetical protein